MKILIVDDEAEIIAILKNYFESNGHIVISARNGREALIRQQKEQPDVIILDVMLPDIDGTEVCRTIRSTSNVPILMLSAKGTDLDQILALGLGADEYATKPFSPSVILAKASALVRRCEGNTATLSKGSRYNCGSLFIDSDAHIVKVDNVVVNLAPKEFVLLLHLIRNSDRVFTKEELFDLIWGDEFGDISTVTVHIRKIREKIEINPPEPKFISTVWGVGYKFSGYEE